MISTATIPTPPGPFTIVADADGAVVASGWTDDPERLLPLIGAPLRPPAAELAAVDRDDPDGPDGPLAPLVQAVRAYVDGDVSAIDTVAVRQAGSPFLTRAWRELRAIPAGAPVTYRELAAQCGRPTAIRAAGSACARNPTALFVPCHRVLRTGGGLGGFAYGLEVKQWLLDHEAHHAVALAA